MRRWRVIRDVGPITRTDRDGVQRTYRSGDTFEAYASEVSSYADKVEDCGAVAFPDPVAEPMQAVEREDGFYVETSDWVLNDVALTREQAESLL